MKKKLASVFQFLKSSRGRKAGHSFHSPPFPFLSSPLSSCFLPHPIFILISSSEEKSKEEEDKQGETNHIFVLTEDDKERWRKTSSLTALASSSSLMVQLEKNRVARDPATIGQSDEEEKEDDDGQDHQGHNMNLEEIAQTYPGKSHSGKSDHDRQHELLMLQI